MFECLCCWIRLWPGSCLVSDEGFWQNAVCFLSQSPEAARLPSEDISPGSNGPKAEPVLLDDDPDDLFAGLWLYYQSLIMTQSQSLDVKISLQSSNEPFTYSESGASWLDSFENALFLLAHSLRHSMSHILLFKCLWSVRDIYIYLFIFFKWKKLILLFIIDALNWSKVTVGIYNVTKCFFQILFFWTFYSSVNP